MRLKQILEHIESIAPSSLQENYDNSGLITGHRDMEISGAVLCLDSVEEVIDEAISLGHNLVIAHHPIVFSGLKRFNGSNYIQRVIIKAIKHDIAIYACHTNLDNVISGVNKEIFDRLGLENLEILSPKSGQLTKLTVFVPDAAKERVCSAIFEAGAGSPSSSYAFLPFLNSGVYCFVLVPVYRDFFTFAFGDFGDNFRVGVCYSVFLISLEVCYPRVDILFLYFLSLTFYLSFVAPGQSTVFYKKSL